MSDNRRHALYRLFSRGELLYVGITSDPLRRFSQHGEDKAWWPQVDKILIEDYPTREALEEAERQAIKTEYPRHNQVHAERSSGWARRQVRLNESLLALGNRGFGISGGDRLPADTLEAGSTLWPDTGGELTVLAAWGHYAYVHVRNSAFVEFVDLTDLK